MILHDMVVEVHPFDGLLTGAKIGAIKQTFTEDSLLFQSGVR